MGDYDLTKFGPWYGDRESSLPDTVASIKKLKKIEANVWLTSHGSGVFEKNPGILVAKVINIYRLDVKVEGLSDLNNFKITGEVSATVGPLVKFGGQSFAYSDLVGTVDVRRNHRYAEGASQEPDALSHGQGLPIGRAGALGEDDDAEALVDEVTDPLERSPHIGRATKGDGAQRQLGGRAQRAAVEPDIGCGGDGGVIA